MPLLFYSNGYVLLLNFGNKKRPRFSVFILEKIGLKIMFILNYWICTSSYPHRPQKQLFCCHKTKHYF